MYSLIFFSFSAENSFLLFLFADGFSGWFTLWIFEGVDGGVFHFDENCIWTYKYIFFLLFLFRILYRAWWRCYFYNLERRRSCLIWASYWWVILLLCCAWILVVFRMIFFYLQTVREKNIFFFSSSPPTLLLSGCLFRFGTSGREGGWFSGWVELYVFASGLMTSVVWEHFIMDNLLECCYSWSISIYQGIKIRSVGDWEQCCVCRNSSGCVWLIEVQQGLFCSNPSFFSPGFCSLGCHSWCCFPW